MPDALFIDDRLDVVCFRINNIFSKHPFYAIFFRLNFFEDIQPTFNFSKSAF